MTKFATMIPFTALGIGIFCSSIADLSQKSNPEIPVEQDGTSMLSVPSPEKPMKPANIVTTNITEPIIRGINFMLLNYLRTPSPLNHFLLLIFIPAGLR